MNIKLPNSQQIGSWLRQAAAAAGISVSVANVGGQPIAQRVVISLVSGLLFVVEHYVSDPSTGTTPPKQQEGNKE